MRKLIMLSVMLLISTSLIAQDGKQIRVCSDPNVDVMITTDPFTDAKIKAIATDSHVPHTILIKYENDDNILLVWGFPKEARAVFIIDDEHRQLSGKVRFGKRTTREVKWIVLNKVLLTLKISRAEYDAIRDGLVIFVQDTWLEPVYMHTVDMSCPAAWKMLDEK